MSEPTTKAEMVEAMRRLVTLAAHAVNNHHFLPAPAMLDESKAALAIAKRLPDPPPAGECRVAHEPTEAMGHAGQFPIVLSRATCEAIYVQMERARVAARRF